MEAAFIIIVIIVLVALIMPKSKSNPTGYSSLSDMPIHKLVTLEPLRASTMLSSYLSLSEDEKEDFICDLCRAIYFCFLLTANKVCKDEEVKAVLLEFYINALYVTNTTFDYDVNPYLDDFDMFLEKNQAEILSDVFSLYEDSSRFTKEEYHKIINDWYHSVYSILYQINGKFILFMEKQFKEFNSH